MMNQEPMRESKPIDAALRKYLDEGAPPLTPLLDLTDAYLVKMRRALIVLALKSRSTIQGLPNGVKTQEVMISPRQPGRIYTPPEAGSPPPLLVYVHGGGWVVGSIETHDPFCRLLSEAAGAIILSTEYRLAPENPYPAALEDVLAAYQWAATHAASFGADPQRLLLGGDSAGGNLAAVIANRISSTGEAVKPEGLMLLYPATDHPDGGHVSYSENATGYGLDADLMKWFWRQYAPTGSPDDPNIYPLRLETMPALPRTLIATAEYDPLRDEGIAYAEKLKKAGVEVTHLHAPDMHHNFPVHPGTVARFPQSVATLHQFARWMRPELKRDTAIDEPMLYCPVCNARLASHQCKLKCERCGYFMSCADYY
jgi:acetyl esterase